MIAAEVFFAYEPLFGLTAERPPAQGGVLQATARHPRDPAPLSRRGGAGGLIPC